LNPSRRTQAGDSTAMREFQALFDGEAVQPAINEAGVEIITRSYLNPA